MKKVIAIALLLALLLVGFALSQHIANSHPTTTDYTYTNAKVPAAFDGYRILLISDLHNAPFAADILAIAEREKPDLVIFCGDMAQLPYESVSQTSRIAEGIAELLPETPIYAVTGNHETQNAGRDYIRDTLKAAGITLLDDLCVAIEREDAMLLLGGLADPGYDYIMKNQYDRARKLIGEFFDGHDTLSILVNHRADMYPEIQAAGADLILSGHLHGGLVRLPHYGPLFGREDSYFPDYAYGYYDGGEAADLIVSGGCDKNKKKPRIFNPPEVVMIELDRPST